MKSEISIALAQMTSTENVQENLETIKKLLASITEPVDWVVLPENALFIKVDGQSPEVSFDLSEEVFTSLQEICKEKQFPILVGGVPIKKNNEVFNSIVVVNAVNSAAVYDKIHLFDVDVEGEITHKESDQYKHGNETIVVSKEGWRIGLSICYDLRFAELYTQYLKDNIDIIFVPAAFLPTTGKAHWEVLLRARAIENQCYVVAPAQVGSHVGASGQQRQTYGHSIVVDPWGEVVCDMQTKSPAIEIVKLSKEKIKNVRGQIPMTNHRRLQPEMENE